MAERETHVNALVTLGCIFCSNPGGQVWRLLRVFPFQLEQVPDAAYRVLTNAVVCRCGRAAGESLLGLGVSLRRGTEQSRDWGRAPQSGLLWSLEWSAAGHLACWESGHIRELERLEGVVAGTWRERRAMSALDGVGWETKGPLWIWVRAGIALGSEGHGA